MVSGEVARQFAERGIELVEPAAGSRAFAAELAAGVAGEPEVVLGQGPWPRRRPSTAAAADARRPWAGPGDPRS